MKIVDVNVLLYALSPARSCRLDIGSGEILALEQQRLAEQNGKDRRRIDNHLGKPCSS